MIDKGAMKPAAQPRLRADFGALFSLDAQGAAGPVAMMALHESRQGLFAEMRSLSPQCRFLPAGERPEIFRPLDSLAFLL